MQACFMQFSSRLAAQGRWASDLISTLDLQGARLRR